MNKRSVLIAIIVVFFLAGGSFFIWKYSDMDGKKEININVKDFSNNAETENEISENAESLPVSEENIADETEKNHKENANIEEEGTEEENKPAVSPKIANKLVSWGYQKASGRSIDTIIIHSSYNALGGDEYSVEKLLGEYKNYGVSPHYLIDRKGNIFRLVEDKNIAYHAGESKMPDGRSGINNFSIGIEMINTKNDKYTDFQYKSLQHLLAYLKKKYVIKYVLGHSDVAKGRKDDPWNFDWSKIK